MDASDIAMATRHCAKHGHYPVRTMLALGRSIEIGSCPACIALADTERHGFESQMQQLAIDARLDRAGVPKRLRTRSFDNFEATTPEQKTARDVCVEYAKNFDAKLASGSVLILAGNTGTGKGHLAAAIAVSVLTNGNTAVFATAQEIVMLLRGSWGNRSEASELEILRMLCRVDLLVIDEVGVQFGSDAERNQLYAVIDGRYREQLPMILTTNLTPAKLFDVLGQRIFSRLREDGKWLPFDWGDWRARRISDVRT